MVARRADPRLGRAEGKITLWNPADLAILQRDRCPRVGHRLAIQPGRTESDHGGGTIGTHGPAKGKRSLKIWGIEGSLFSLANRRR